MEESAPGGFPVTGGDSYLVAGWVNTPTGAAIIGFRWSDGSLSTESVTVPASTWTQVQAVQQAPPGATFAWEHIAPADGAGNVIYAQAVTCLPSVPGGLIQAGTVEAVQLVAGIVVAGVVDGTVITGAQIVATGSAGEILAYDGTGNLVASVNAQPSFTDPYGNVAGVGVFAYASASQLAALQGGDVLIQNGSFPWTISVDNATQSVFITLPHTGQGVSVGPTKISPVSNPTLGIGSGVALDSVSPPATPGSGLVLWADSDIALRYRGTDGSVYACGKRTITFTSTQTISSATFVTLNDGLNNFSANVSAAKYKFRARIIYEPSGTTGNPSFTITTPAFSSGGAIFTCQFNGIASGFARYSNSSGLGGAFAGPANSTVGTTVFVAVDIEGTAVFTASGTVAIRAETGGGSNFVIQQGSFFELEPL
jgi:hypothetical protein